MGEFESSTRAESRNASPVSSIERRRITWLWEWIFLTHVLEHGAEVPAYSDFSIEEPSKEILQILLDHGSDIKARRMTQQPFLWEAVDDGDLVTWCLDHDATTIPKDLDPTGENERREVRYGCPLLLEKAAVQSTVATFELVRSKGAQLDRRAVHFTSRAAINSGEGEEERPEIPEKDHAKFHSERMAMGIHLVDELEIDPNALDQPKGWMMGNHWGTPLCYVALSNLAGTVVIFFSGKVQIRGSS